MFTQPPPPAGSDNGMYRKDRGGERKGGREGGGKIGRESDKGGKEHCTSQHIKQSCTAFITIYWLLYDFIVH